MTAVEKLRAIVDTIKNLRAVMPDVANSCIPSGRFEVTASDCVELLQEIDRMRSGLDEAIEWIGRGVISDNGSTLIVTLTNAEELMDRLMTI